MQNITPCLWFDTQAEEAAELYTSVFPNSRVAKTTYYGEAGPREAGAVMTVEVELNGSGFVLLNGGPEFAFGEAISFQVHCDTQEEVDHYWDRLGERKRGPCGWVKDRFGVSWQVVPNALPRLLEQGNGEQAQRVMAAMLKMDKLVIADLEAAAEA